jgi:ferredoxin
VKILVDLDLCEANGLCMDACDEVFEVTEHDVLVVHDDKITPERASAIREAVRLCPRGALTLDVR